VPANTFDAVIVGGGHNGLTAACYLATAGHSVAVVEQAAVLGGMTHSAPMISGAPRHMINTCAGDAIFLRATSVVDDLQLKRHGWQEIEPDPSYVYLHPDGQSVAIWRDPAKTIAEIARYSRKDADAYAEFLRLLDMLMGMALPMMQSSKRSFIALKQAIGTFVRNRHLRGELLALLTGTADQAVMERFEHPVTISFLLNFASTAGSLDDDGSGLSHIRMALMHRVGVGRPVGGMQALPNALSSRLKELGGTIFTGVSVTEIVADEAGVRAVELGDGRRLAAHTVISSCDPLTAVKLVSEGAIAPRLLRRMEHAPANRLNISPLMAHVALSEQLRLKDRFLDARGGGADLRSAALMIGTADQVRNSLASAKRGEYSNDPYLWVVIPSGWDPSQAPPGADVLYLYIPGGPVMANDPSSGAASRATDAALRQAAHFFDGIDNEIGRWVETPLDRAKRLNVRNGCITHIDSSILRSGGLRPAAGLGGGKQAVKGLFFGGAGTHPGGGVSGLPGKHAAERASTFLRRSGR
jgi:phytoene dehydrogenase-like protein